MKILITLACLLSWGYTLSQHQQTLTLSSLEAELQGTLLLPEDRSADRVVLIISGSGPTDRNGNNHMMQNNSLKLLAEGLANSGIASFRYDKRGVGTSTSALAEKDLRFSHFVDDAVRWIHKLRTDHQFKNIIILGHSEGSLVGMLASQEADADAFISLAGPGRPAADILREQLSAQPAEVLEVAEPMLHKLVRGDSIGFVPPGLYALFRPSVQPYLSSWFKHDPAATIKQLEIPVLILQGTTDLQVAVKDAHLLKNANTHAELQLIKGMNHILKEASMERSENLKTYSNPELPLHPDLLPSVIQFTQMIK